MAIYYAPKGFLEAAYAALAAADETDLEDDDDADSFDAVQDGSRDG